MAFLTVKPLEGSGRSTNEKAKPVLSVARGFDAFRMAGGLPLGARGVSGSSAFTVQRKGDLSYLI